MARDGHGCVADSTSVAAEQFAQGRGAAADRVGVGQDGALAMRDGEVVDERGVLGEQGVGEDAEGMLEEKDSSQLGSADEVRHGGRRGRLGGSALVSGLAFHGVSRAPTNSGETVPTAASASPVEEVTVHGCTADRLRRAAVAVAVKPVAHPRDVERLSPNVLSVRHWDRLMAGALYAATPRVDWASLLRRGFNVDLMACTKCGGRLRGLAVITERESVRRILDQPRRASRRTVTRPRLRSDGRR
jgi:hypothetical protein